MKQAECTIIMYHYVRNMPETDYPNIKGLLIKDFISQLNYILENYSIISLKDYIDFLDGVKEIPLKCCVLTFDDGLKDHYENVFPILKEKKIPACFFPITQPLTEFIVPIAHQTHFLLAKLGSKFFSDEFNRILKSRFPELVSEFSVNGRALKQKKCQWDKSDILAGNLKYNISLMPPDFQIKLLKPIFNKYFKSQKAFCQNLYMTFKQMREIQEQGMSFGSHSHNHFKLSELSPKEQKKEIKDSKEILEKELRTEIKFFSYPYGSYNNITIGLLSQQGYLAGLTTDFDKNIGKNINHFALKRLDTNHLPLSQGKKPITKL